MEMRRREKVRDSSWELINENANTIKLILIQKKKISEQFKVRFSGFMFISFTFGYVSHSSNDSTKFNFYKLWFCVKCSMLIFHNNFLSFSSRFPATKEKTSHLKSVLIYVWAWIFFFFCTSHSRNSIRCHEP